MSNQEVVPDFFGDGMRIFLSYIDRKYQENSDYKPHPIIRSFEAALSQIEEVEVGENVAGTSGNNVNNVIYSPYLVVLQKKQEGIEVKEIRNLEVDKELPLDVMIIIFRLQIHLDKIDGNLISPRQAVDILNELLGKTFWLLGDRWQEARDVFKKRLEKQELRLPPLDENLIEELTSITRETPWEEYSNRLRSIIGGAVADHFNEEGNIVVTTPLDSSFEKAKVFQIAIQTLIGKASKYLNVNNRLN